MTTNDDKTLSMHATQVFHTHSGKKSLLIAVPALPASVAVPLERLGQLSENLIELVRGKEYLSWKADVGTQRAGIMSQGTQSHYTQICYYAPKQVRTKIRRGRARLVRQGILSEEEAERICVYWYPLAQTSQEHEQEEQEDDDAFDRDLAEEGN